MPAQMYGSLPPQCSSVCSPGFLKYGRDSKALPFSTPVLALVHMTSTQDLLGSFQLDGSSTMRSSQAACPTDLTAALVAGLLAAAAALAPAGSSHLEAALNFLEELPRSSILPGGGLHAAVAGAAHMP